MQKTLQVLLFSLVVTISANAEGVNNTNSTEQTTEPVVVTDDNSTKETSPAEVECLENGGAFDSDSEECALDPDNNRFLCEDNGGFWIKEEISCDYSNPNNRMTCEESGGEWKVDSKTCFNEEEYRNNLIVTIQKAVKSKNFNVSGYFLHYGEDAYDWIFVSNDGSKFAKFEGTNEEGFMDYTSFDMTDLNYFPRPTSDGKIKFFSEADLAYYEPPVSASEEEMQSEISKLNSENSALRSQIKELESSLSSIQKDFDELKSKKDFF
jgi:hypothetical protein